MHACARAGDAATAAVLGAAAGGAGVLDWLDRWGRAPLCWCALREDAKEAVAVAGELLKSGASPTPVVLSRGVQSRRTTLPPEGPLEIAVRRLPPDGGALGELLRTAAC